jgi:uncharacterized membrane protein YkgB
VLPHSSKSASRTSPADEQLKPLRRWIVAPDKQQLQEASLLGTILIILLILLLIGALPRWGHSTNWGYGPSGILGLILVVIVILLLMGRF